MSTLNNSLSGSKVNSAASTLSLSESNSSSVSARDANTVKFFVLLIAIGTVCGAAIGFSYTSSAPGTLFATSLLSAISYATVGASAGLLVAGLYDIVFHGTMEEHYEHVDESSAGTI